MKDIYTLGEVARILGRKPHQVVYPLVTGKIPEPESRIAGKRVFSTEDVSRLARHFHVSPRWEALTPISVDDSSTPPIALTLRPPFEVCHISETGHEIKDAEGEVFAWAGDRAHALIIAGLLEAAVRG